MHRLFPKARSTCKFGIGRFFHTARMNEGGKSGVRSKGTYRRYQTNEGETGKTAGSKDSNDKEALLAISSKETQ